MRSTDGIMAKIGNHRKLIYCSGSQYSPEERNGMLEISSVLEKSGFETYLPFRDGVEFWTLQLANNPDIDQTEVFEILTVVNKASFALDIYQVVQRCDALVFNMNGRTPEEGSVFKTSLAYSTGKPLVLYKNDNRSVFHGRDNTMITGLSGNFTVVRRLSKLPGALTKVIAKTQPDLTQKDKGSDHPPFIERVIKLGERVWDLLHDIDSVPSHETEFQGRILDFKDRCKNLLEKVPLEV